MRNVDLCPFCSSAQISIVDSRMDGAMRRRARKCLDCNKRFFTIEIAESDYRKLVDDSSEGQLRMYLESIKSLRSEISSIIGRLEKKDMELSSIIDRLSKNC